MEIVFHLFFLFKKDYSDDQVAAAIAEVDTDKSGTIEWNEFLGLNHFFVSCVRACSRVCENVI